MKIVIMEANTLGNDVDLGMFQEFGDVVIYGESNPLENAERIKDADVIIVNKIPMNEDILKGATKLKLICLTATGTNNIDFTYTEKRGISVANVKGYSTQSVVQHTFALLFYVYEKLAYYDQYVKSGDYTRSDIFSNFDVKFHELYGKTFGIIGLGEIGQGVAKIAELFGCKVVYYSTSGKNLNSDYERVDLQTLLKISDVVSIHAPLTKATTNLIGEAELEMMKPDAILLNLGRGAIVNQEALANALLAGKIGGAGLDVLTVEPMLADNPLLKVKDSTRLIITPHIAWATVEARNRCAKEVYFNIKSYLSGEPRNIVE
ncbi:D-2-hydroxyacid dehydrogenase [Lachnoclostridium phytofermentans]|uniref:D-isomer specific 2-hydroxyacid dehydrogenase NAD-binding n=1 Tax=Lachnoclostridium phytofermentans (strain ATCC 700394 / DSM 18823 / ISDg) TaxID=357809 RepID=A9KLE8_LACP7|nr:D-2-hydroxyacid dehydrogenase [Lachnoclostridium phytofermentans]ABX41277.1 D-isomer specific 2-hydroxyacid dehydrogenase NAD-binding [Lachnoclostridium phytofermentans ISDg]